MTHLGLHDGLLDVAVCEGICDGVSDADAVPFNHEEVVDHLLDVAVEIPGCVVPKLRCYHVHQRPSLVAQSVFRQNTTDELSMLNNYLNKIIHF